MSKWSCSCGARMDDHKCPDDNYYRVFSDEDWNNISTDEYDALAFANIVPEEQTNGKIRLKVLGKIPSIPIRLLVSVRTSV